MDEQQTHQITELLGRWELDKALLVQLQEKAETLKNAMADTDGGAYGICERCNKPINPDRLAVLPDATLCINCARNA